MKNINLTTLAPVLAMAIVALAGLPVSQAVAGTNTDIVFNSVPTQGQLNELTRELGQSISPPMLAPAEALGLGHVDAGLSAMATNINADADYWTVASGDDKFPSYLVAPRATVRVGLPWRLDIGASYSSIPSSNVDLIGGEIKWTFLKSRKVTPPVALRVAHQQLRGVNELDMEATSADLSVSKRFPVITPYGGVGSLWLDSEVGGIDPFPKASLGASERVNRVFAGARISAAWLNTTIEAQRTGSLSSYALRFAFVVP